MFDAYENRGELWDDLYYYGLLDAPTSPVAFEYSEDGVGRTLVRAVYVTDWIVEPNA